jgi:acetyl-CoA synthetase
MFYLTARSGYKPIIEYCGGTELAGGYVAGTVLQSARLGCFTTAVFGLQLHIRNDEGEPTNRGEVFIEPPAIGLSTRLLNADNHDVYYEGTPRADGVPLRRHGDEVERLTSGDFRVHGRCDDTMNLGGIKVSSVEIERVLNVHPSIRETAAVPVPRDSGGPDELAVFAVLANESLPAARLRDELQQYLRERLNPLFKISSLQIVTELPRTASNKILRRQLKTLSVSPTRSNHE